MTLKLSVLAGVTQSLWQLKKRAKYICRTAFNKDHMRYLHFTFPFLCHFIVLFRYISEVYTVMSLIHFVQHVVKDVLHLHQLLHSSDEDADASVIIMLWFGLFVWHFYFICFVLFVWLRSWGGEAGRDFPDGWNSGLSHTCSASNHQRQLKCSGLVFPLDLFSTCWRGAVVSLLALLSVTFLLSCLCVSQLD